MDCYSLFPDLPNSYTFSKIVAEALVAKEVNNLPVVITRPVIGKFAHPF